MAKIDVFLESTDVLIAGSEAAGRRAAIAAHDIGADVALRTKGPRRANYTGMSRGRYNVVSRLNPGIGCSAYRDAGHVPKPNAQCSAACYGGREQVQRHQAHDAIRARFHDGHDARQALVGHADTGFPDRAARSVDPT